MDETPDPPPFTRFHPRCLEVEKKLARARMRMAALGIVRLLDGRPAWKRETGGNVIPIGRDHAPRA